ncbi:hypothetical protein AALB39_04270 [Lachnospiraceae bacterium 54-53]
MSELTKIIKETNDINRMIGLSFKGKDIKDCMKYICNLTGYGVNQRIVNKAYETLNKYWRESQYPVGEDIFYKISLGGRYFILNRDLDKSPRRHDKKIDIF